MHQEINSPDISKDYACIFSASKAYKKLFSRCSRPDQ